MLPRLSRLHLGRAGLSTALSPLRSQDSPICTAVPRRGFPRRHSGSPLDGPRSLRRASRGSSATLLDWWSKADIRNFDISIDGRVELNTAYSHRVSPL